MHHLGTRYFISQDPHRIEKADRVIFPGVGEAKAAMKVLKSTGLDEAIRRFCHAGKPFLGVCIGCQLIFDASDERNAQCLGLLKGSVRRFEERLGIKIPHMGWNSVVCNKSHPVFTSVPSGATFYFVHSYYPSPQKRACIIGETDYGVTFSSAIAWENLVACQFHPEKSGPNGLQLLSNFLQWNV